MNDGNEEKPPRRGMSDATRYLFFIGLGIFNLLYSTKLLSGRSTGVAAWLSLAIGLPLIGGGLWFFVKEIRKKRG